MHGRILGGVMAAFALAVGACTVDDIDLVGRPCPCPQELTCDEDSQTCVERASGTAGGSSGAAGAGGGCAGPGCPIVVDEYDIDATEVTRGAYQTFLDAGVDPAGQPAYCAWNDSFAPRTDGDCEGKVFDPVTYPDVPVTCIDVCDARAYCTWKGRHLCGKIGGGKLLSDFGGDVEQSEWFRACSAAGAKAYPYGDTFEPNGCKTAGAPGGAQPIDVETFATCQGGYPGLFDMSGNVAEWEDACADGADGMVGNVDDSCLVRGGAFWAQDTDARCDAMMYRPPGNAVSNDWGFRCCGG